MRRITSLFFFCGFIAYVPLLLAQETSSIISPLTKEQKEKLELKREALNKERKKAESLKDEDMIVVLDSLDKYLEAQSLCFNKNEDLDIDICLLTALKTMANKENFIAEHYLGNMFEHSYKNNEMAVYWYKKALNNTKTPNIYKYEILEDIDRIKKASAPGNKPERRE